MNLRTPLFCVLMPMLFAACSHNDSPDSDPPPVVRDSTFGAVQSWLTTPDQNTLLQAQTASNFTNTTNGLPTIDIDTTQQYQTMEGFGYTLTGGSAQVINQMSETEKSNFLTEIFGNGEHSIGVSYLRISIGASDLDSAVFSYDDIPVGQTDINLDHFTLDRDRTNLIPVLKKILQINPNIHILGSPWSPPVWMKDNGSSIGGTLKSEYYAVYAQYLVRYIQDMKTEGININAITPQNEPLNPGNNPSLSMTADLQADFIKNHLGPAFLSNGLSTKIIIYDHNADRPDYPISILNDNAASLFIDGSAFHLYSGDISALSSVHDLHPDKNIYFTEQYTAVNGDFAGDLNWHIKNLIIGAPRNWSRTVLEWNLANDASFGPHTDGGCTTCKGAVTIGGSTFTRNVGYYIIAHASKFVTPNSVRVNSTNIPGFSNVAYKTPEGKMVVIVLCEGTGSGVTQFNIKVSNKVLTTSILPGAVVTFVW